jgi:hypothetical protein
MSTSLELSLTTVIDVAYRGGGRGAGDVRDEPDKARLQPLLENPKPVAAQNFFDFLVVETALNQFTSEVAGVRMVP